MSGSRAANIPQHELLLLSKRKQSSSAENQTQNSAQTSKRRKSYSVDVKAQAIRMRLERGMTLQQISDAFGLPASGGKKMVRKWIKDKDKIFGALDAEQRVARKVRRRTIAADVEDRLFAWLNDQKARGLQVLNADLREKARELVGDGFRASVGWLVGFKKRYRIEVKQPNLDMSIPLPHIPQAALPGRITEACSRGNAGRFDEDAEQGVYSGGGGAAEDDEYDSASSGCYEDDNDFDLSLFDSTPIDFVASENGRPHYSALPAQPTMVQSHPTAQLPIGSQPVVVSQALHVPLSVTSSSSANSMSTVASVTATVTATATTTVTATSTAPNSAPLLSMTFVSAPVHMSGAIVSMIPASNVTVMIPTPTFRVAPTSAAQVATTTGMPVGTPTMPNESQLFQRPPLSQPLQQHYHPVSEQTSTMSSTSHAASVFQQQTALNINFLAEAGATNEPMQNAAHINVGHAHSNPYQQHGLQASSVATLATVSEPELPYRPHDIQATAVHRQLSTLANPPGPDASNSSFQSPRTTERMLSASSSASPTCARQQQDTTTPGVMRDMDALGRAALEAFLSPSTSHS